MTKCLLLIFVSLLASNAIAQEPPLLPDTNFPNPELDCYSSVTPGLFGSSNRVPDANLTRAYEISTTKYLPDYEIPFIDKSRGRISINDLFFAQEFCRVCVPQMNCVGGETPTSREIFIKEHLSYYFLHYCQIAIGISSNRKNCSE